MAEFDDLFSRLRTDQVWGTFVFILKDGIVRKITYQRDFLNVQDALDGLLSHEEKPGDQHEDNLHERRKRSAAGR